MERFDIHILGCGSALPTKRWNPSSQVVNFREKLFMIDCGEGTQVRFRKQKLTFNKIGHLLVSHLHGDHCFGILGMISTMDLLGRTNTLTIHAPELFEKLLFSQLNFFCSHRKFEIKFESFPTNTKTQIYEDKGITITTIPLKHRLPCCGFLFEEKPLPKHLIREMIDFHHIPIKELQQIKQGADFRTPEGQIIPNKKLTRPAEINRSYAYCSDTKYNESIIPQIQNATLLFHESTFCNDQKERAESTYHSTASQAATIAKKGNVKRLILGHYSSRYTTNIRFEKEARAVFPDTIAANEGDVFSL